MEGIARAAEERQQRAFTETLGGTISAPTTAAHAGMAAQVPAAKPQDAADKKAEEQRKRARDSASGEWSAGADTSAKQQQRRDLSGAKHTYSGEGVARSWPSAPTRRAATPATTPTRPARRSPRASAWRTSSRSL